MLPSTSFRALAVFSLFGTSISHAETITACRKGCDHTSINAAIDASKDGDVIELSAEIYTVTRRKHVQPQTWLIHNHEPGKDLL